MAHRTCASGLGRWTIAATEVEGALDDVRAGVIECMTGAAILRVDLLVGAGAGLR